MKRILISICILLCSSCCFGAAIFEDNFDSGSDWTVAQQVGTTTSCQLGSSCGLPNGWDAYYNGANLCGSGVSGRPGNNTIYIDTGAGYPNESTGCFSGSKCYTNWQESCVDGFEDSDGSLFVNLDAEYYDVYVRFKIKFQSGYEEMGSHDWQMKLYHIYHAVPGSYSWDFFNRSSGNFPLDSGGLSSYSDGQLYFYAQHSRTVSGSSITNWPLGTITSNRTAGGLWDGDWHTIEMRFVINSSIGVADGVMQLWIDGTQKTSWVTDSPTAINYVDGGTDYRGFRIVGIGGNNDNQFDLSSSTMSSREQWYAVDDVVISETYVGTSYTIGGTSPTVSTVSGLSITGGSVQ